MAIFGLKSGACPENAQNEISKERNCSGEAWGEIIPIVSEKLACSESGKDRIGGRLVVAASSEDRKVVMVLEDNGNRERMKGQHKYIHGRTPQGELLIVLPELPDNSHLDMLNALNSQIGMKLQYPTGGYIRFYKRGRAMFKSHVFRVYGGSSTCESGDNKYVGNLLKEAVSDMFPWAEVTADNKTL